MGGIGNVSTAEQIIARLDRIPIWSLSYLFIGIIGIGYVFTFFDIFDINVSFIQTAITTFHAVSPPAANALIGLPVEFNLLGYIVGALLLSPFSDSIGRRNMLLITLLITGIGSLATSFVTNYPEFIAGRFVTGIGIGADLAIVNTYISEAAPVNGRARYTSILFILAGVGVFAAVWLGLYLTTPAAPFPYGLPVAIGGSGFMAHNGWRVMYGIGAVLAFVGVILRLEMPESPRWLISKERLSDADSIVRDMEQRAAKKLTQLPPVPETIPYQRPAGRVPYSEILRDRIYRKRMAILLAVWFFGYITLYTVAAGLTTLLVGVGFPFPENGIIVAVGIVGFIVAGIAATFIGDRWERKYWISVAALITLIGGISIAEGLHDLTLAILGSFLIFFGMDLWVPVGYAWSAESFPTRARTSGFAMVDGIGHAGGGLALIFAASIIAALPILGVFVLIAGFLIIAAIIAVFGQVTAKRRLDEISP